jgi:hypothetical protein
VLFARCLKEIMVFVERIEQQLKLLDTVPFSGDAMWERAMRTI